jgi:hypothetical protein
VLLAGESRGARPIKWRRPMATADEVALRVIDGVNAHDLSALRKLYAPDARIASSLPAGATWSNRRL